MHRPRRNAIESKGARRWVRLISLQAAGLLSVLAVGFALTASGEGRDPEHGSAQGSTRNMPRDDGGAQMWAEAPLRTTSASELRAGSGAVAESQPTHTHAAESVTGADTQADMPEVPHAPEPMEAAEPLIDDMTSDAIAAVGAMPREHAIEGVGTGAGNTHPKNHPQPGAEELACLSGLTARARELTARLVDYDAAVAEGYRMPAREGGTHHPNPTYQHDGSVFDLAKPESAIYRRAADGSKALIGVLYHAPVGSGPTPCGNATWWHTHPICVEPSTRARLDAGPDGVCPEGALLREGRTEMLHLWFVPRRGSN